MMLRKWKNHFLQWGGETRKSISVIVKCWNFSSIKVQRRSLLSIKNLSIKKGSRLNFLHQLQTKMKSLILFIASSIQKICGGYLQSGWLLGKLSKKKYITCLTFGALDFLNSIWMWLDTKHPLMKINHLLIITYFQSTKRTVKIKRKLFLKKGTMIL